MTLPEHMHLAALEAELRRRLRAEGYEFPVSASSLSFDLPYDPVADDFDEFEIHRALARRPVIRDQGPPPVRRQPAPRPVRPPPRRLAWLVEGRGR